MQTVSFDKMTVRAQKAFGAHSGSKAFANLPTPQQDAVIALEHFLKLFAQIVSVDAPMTARVRAIVALKGSM